MTITELRAQPSTEEFGDMSPTEFVGLLRDQLRTPGGGMVDHPMVRAMEDGSATVDQLKLFGTQFYLHITNMLPWIGLMYVNCPFPEVRPTLVKNLAEEELGIFSKTNSSHPALLLHWLEALGADLDEVKRTPQLTVGRRLTDYFEFMGRCRPWFVPLAAIGIGLESFVPDTFTRITAAQRLNYDMSDEALIFWDMHIIADVEHGDEGIEIVTNYVHEPEGRKQTFDCTAETGRLFYDLWNVYTEA